MELTIERSWLTIESPGQNLIVGHINYWHLKADKMSFSRLLPNYGGGGEP